MKRTLFFSLMFIFCFFVGTQKAQATCAPLTVSMSSGSNNATAFTADSQVGVDGSATYYVTWDATYVYFGWTGGRTNYSSDLYYAAIDVDPGSSNGSSATIENTDFSEAVFDYYVVYENNASFYGAPVTNGNAYELYQNNAGAWNFVSRTAGDDGTSSQVVFSDGPGEVRLRIAWADLGFTPGAGNDIRFTMWTNNSSGNFVWSSFPSDNPTGSTPVTLTHGFTFSTTEDGTCPAAAASNGTLPVEFGEVKAFEKEGNINIEWYTETELNNSHFEIEKSDDLRNWSLLGLVETEGSSFVRLEYSYIDFEPFIGINYYRIKQVDINGQFTYSEIASANFESLLASRIYPNPVQNHLSIELGDDVNGFVMVYNVQGRLIAQVAFEATRRFNINLSGTNSGLLFVQLQDENGRIIKSERLLKL